MEAADLAALGGFIGLVLILFVAARVGSRRRASTPAAKRRPGEAADDDPIRSAAHGGRFDAEAARPMRRRVRGRAWVVDGDTIRVDGVQVRLFGVDAPELDHPYGRKAKSALLRLCRGEVVEAEVTDMDVHGRTVALCRLPDGRDLSAEMVRLGLALDWAKFSGGAYRRFEPPGVRRRLFLADARQKGRMDVWERFESRRRAEGPRRGGAP